ncbi:hypothetical protein E1281_25310 [Actinomadura sp. KC345]|uniref:hypothetical protein n=1 Tax=Actinomadura sp. KC345 TaxID=2530371 RepID=UPI00104A3F73|nr:hypothetical protein [Actinomadura sp. KC345]TDC48065.1 hypothetical protein E1281_25310 [Actinomadura sp. KC345]
MLPQARKLGWRTLVRPGSLPLVSPVEVPPEPSAPVEFAPGRVYVQGLQDLPRKPYGKPARSVREKADRWMAWMGAEAVVGDAAVCHHLDGEVRAFAEIAGRGRVGYWSLGGNLPSRPVTVGKRTEQEAIPLDEIDKVVIKAGPCLLSGPGFTLHTADGPFEKVLSMATTDDLASAVHGFDWTKGPSLYEVESTARQAEAIGLIVLGLLSRSKGLEIEILLNVPNTGYDLYFLPGAQKGHIPAGLYLDLISLWDGRTSLVEGLLRENLVKSLHGNLDAEQHARVKILPFEDDLDIVRDMLREALESRGRLLPELATLFDQQVLHGDETWKAMGSTGRPDNVHAGASWGYTHAVLKHSMSKDPSSERVLLIGVENASEGRIKAEADRMAKAIVGGYSDLITAYPGTTFDNVAIYPYEGIHAETEAEPESGGRLTALYYNDPGFTGELPNGQRVDFSELLLAE